MEKITTILTCFNRKDKTLNCVKCIDSEPLDVDFIVVDDNSTDNTIDELSKMRAKIEVLVGNGSLFWAGGMRSGINQYFNRKTKSDYVLLVNDDVEFRPGFLKELVYLSKANNRTVVVGATCGSSSEITYGAYQIIKSFFSLQYKRVIVSKDIVLCDTFNCNCVLIPSEILLEVGNFDNHFRHSLADLDYGLRIRERGYHIIQSNNYVGKCDRNAIEGTWRDVNLGRINRIKKKESIKGDPVSEHFYFLNKHFGIVIAIKYSISPYIKILLKK